MTITLEPIGVLHTPFTQPDSTPIQAVRSQALGWIEIFEAFTPGLQDLQEFSHLILIYHLHRCQETRLLVEPFLDDKPHGIFATRHPFRPNHLGLSVVELMGCSGSRLDVRGVDMVDQSPLVDIKPFVPDFDLRQNARAGWYERRAKP